MTEALLGIIGTLLLVFIGVLGWLAVEVVSAKNLLTRIDERQQSERERLDGIEERVKALEDRQRD